MWIDSHCHLVDDKIDLGEAVTGENLDYLINIGCEAKDWQESCDIAERYENVSVALGVHPHVASEGIEGLENFLANDQVVAVGECGLDYHYDNSPREEQRTVFAEQIELAHKHSLPLVIHTRSAWDDTFSVLGECGWPANTVIHCFTGGVAEAEKCLEQGAHISFSGIVTFPSAVDDVAAAAKVVPLDRMLVETDSPYLSPVPHRGVANVPARVAVVGEFIAGLRGQLAEEVAAATSANTKRFFGLD